LESGTISPKRVALYDRNNQALNLKLFRKVSLLLFQLKCAI
jgi:hypothetical protein